MRLTCLALAALLVASGAHATSVSIDLDPASAGIYTGLALGTTFSIAPVDGDPVPNEGQPAVDNQTQATLSVFANGNLIDQVVRTIVFSVENAAAGFADILTMRSIPGPAAFPPVLSAAEFADAVANGAISTVDFSVTLSSGTSTTVNNGDTYLDAFVALQNGEFSQLLSSFWLLTLTPGPNSDMSLYPGGQPIERFLVVDVESAVVPEPSVFFLVAVGVLALAALRRRRRA